MKTRKTKRTLLKFLLFLVLACALIMLDSRYRIVTTDYTVSSPDIPAGFDGFKIVQLSDVHGAEFGRDNVRLLSKVESAGPDIIALTGDLVDANTDMEVIDALLRGLCGIAPVYFVSGNHEWASGLLPELEELFDKYGVIYLKNDYVLLQRGNDSVVLAGVEDPNGWKDMLRPDELVDIIRENCGDKYTILLGHRNYWATEYPDLEVDIIFCGHAHGGIVRLPFLGGVIGAGYELFPDYVDGEYELESYTMLVSRGLGGSVPVPRFLNNPQIVTVTLKAE